ncbi:TonB family protein [Brevundimonas pondensis]|uniref:energy transducer TonB n=1 Tax=Brevundimonas pondensis TaxID=2774189 RepID=UPI00320AECB2
MSVLHLGVLTLVGVGLMRPVNQQGGAPVIQLSLEGPGFASEAAVARPARTGSERSQAASANNPAIAPVSDAARLGAPVLRIVSQAAVGPAVMFEPGLAGAVEPAATERGGDEPTAGASAAPSTASSSPGGGAPVVGATGVNAVDQYEAQVIAWLEQHKRHPGGIIGRTVVGFTLDRRGRLLSSSVVTSSGERRLDQVALSQLQEAAPFPRAPTGTAWRTRSFVVRLDYRSRRA